MNEQLSEQNVMLCEALDEAKLEKFICEDEVKMIKKAQVESKKEIDLLKEEEKELWIEIETLDSNILKTLDSNILSQEEHLRELLKEKTLCCKESNVFEVEEKRKLKL